MANMNVNGFINSVGGDTGKSKKKRRGLGIADIERGFLTTSGTAVPETASEDDGMTGMADEDQSQQTSSKEPSLAPERDFDREDDIVTPPAPKPQDKPKEEPVKASDNPSGKQGNVSNADIDALTKKLDQIIKSNHDILSKLNSASDRLNSVSTSASKASDGISGIADLKGDIKAQFGSLRKLIEDVRDEVSEKDNEILSKPLSDTSTIPVEEYDTLLEQKESSDKFAKQMQELAETTAQEVSDKNKEVEELTLKLKSLTEENEKLKAENEDLKSVNEQLKPYLVKALNEKKQRAQSGNPVQTPTASTMPQVGAIPTPVAAAPQPVIQNSGQMQNISAVQSGMPAQARAEGFTGEILPATGTDGIGAISPAPSQNVDAVQPVMQQNVSYMPPQGAPAGYYPLPAAYPGSNLPQGVPSNDDVPNVWGNDAPPPRSGFDDEEPKKKKGFFRRK